MAAYDNASPSGHRHPACRVNRLANIGIDCRAEMGSPVDLDRLTDRDYDYLCETSDDGWLIAGGDDTKLKRPDTAHAEVWRYGPDNAEDGGIAHSTVDAMLRTIRFPPVTFKPKKINFTPKSEIELLLEYEPGSIAGRLFSLFAKVLACPCGHYGNPFHITLVRGVEFRSDAHKIEYLRNKQAVVDEWRETFPDGVKFNDGGIDLYVNREEILHHYSPSEVCGVEANVGALLSMRATNLDK
ncbi:MAG: hypothetical protein AAGB11_00085 [Pseudomonadota bacterium]